MAIEEISNISASLVASLGKIGLWLQAVGIIVIIWIIFYIVDLFINVRRMKEVYRIKDDMKRIERKIDKVLAKKVR